MKMKGFSSFLWTGVLLDMNKNGRNKYYVIRDEKVSKQKVPKTMDTN